MDTIEFLKSLCNVTLEYVTPDRDPETRQKLNLPDRDIEAVIASDSLVKKGSPITLFEQGQPVGETTLKKVFSARGYPEVIKWRKSKREAIYRQTPESKAQTRHRVKQFKATHIEARR